MSLFSMEYKSSATCPAAELSLEDYVLASFLLWPFYMHWSKLWTHIYSLASYHATGHLYRFYYAEMGNIYYINLHIWHRRFFMKRFSMSLPGLSTTPHLCSINNNYIIKTTFRGKCRWNCSVSTNSLLICTIWQILWQILHRIVTE